ncbi:MFS transporter [Pendulispora rubella]|uniref:MFS transporter n=1 Tax=Pendulispora rubella TaxID=2741070 RepID=A0ABZ2KQ64_9BACT
MMIPPALRELRFAAYWCGIVISLSGHMMGIVVRGWLVNELTHSSVWLGGVYAMVGLPGLVLGPFAGALVDRVDRGKVLLVTQALHGLNALLLAITILTGSISPPLLLVFALAAGSIGSFDWTVRLAIVPKLVRPESLDSAVALSSGAWILAGVLGPAVAGVLLPRIGAAGCFFVTAAAFLPSVLTAFRRTAIPPEPSKPGDSWLQSTLQGYRYILGRRLLRTLLVLEGIPVVFGLPFTTLFPILAERAAVGSNEETLGLLHSAVGVGAILGAIFSSMSLRTARRGRALLVSAGAFGAGLMTFAVSKPFLVLVALLVAIGAVESIFSTLNATLVQRITDEAYRGRVMSVYNLPWGITPVGGLSLGLLAKAFDPGVAIALHGSFIALLVVGIAAANPELRRTP